MWRYVAPCGKSHVPCITEHVSLSPLGLSMANISQKNGVFHVRFRYAGKQYKKSLRTRDPAAAQAACHLVELTIYRLTTGQLYLPQQVDVGDFIVSGGTRTETSRMIALSIERLIEQYLVSRIGVADSTKRTEQIHLGHFQKFLGNHIHRPCSQVSARDLQRYLTARASQCASVTLKKERATLVQLFQWAKTQGYLQDVPTTGLPRVQGASDRRAFRTMDQITLLVERGGLSEKMLRELWECLDLSTVEIARRGGRNGRRSPPPTSRKGSAVAARRATTGPRIPDPSVRRSNQCAKYDRC